MKVFLAGATGVLGRALVPQLVARGHEVVGMTRSASKQDMVRSLGARPVVADALDPDAVAQAVASAEPEVIVHELTALSGPMTIRDARHPERFSGAIMTNRLRTEATDHLLAAGRAMGARRFVAQSFGAFRWARTGGPVLTETPLATGMLICGTVCPLLVKTTARAAGLLAARRASGTVLVSAKVTSTCAVPEPAAGAGMRALTMSMASAISVVVTSGAAGGAVPVPISTGAWAPLACWPQAASARTTPAVPATASARSGGRPDTRFRTSWQSFLGGADMSLYSGAEWTERAPPDLRAIAEYSAQPARAPSWPGRGGRIRCGGK